MRRVSVKKKGNEKVGFPHFFISLFLCSAVSYSAVPVCYLCKVTVGAVVSLPAVTVVLVMVVSLYPCCPLK